MRDIRMLFKYQKFVSGPPGLQAKIDAVTEKYLSNRVELADDELDVAAAGEPYYREPHLEK